MIEKEDLMMQPETTECNYYDENTQPESVAIEPPVPEEEKVQPTALEAIDPAESVVSLAPMEMSLDNLQARKYTENDSTFEVRTLANDELECSSEAPYTTDVFSCDKEILPAVSITPQHLESLTWVQRQILKMELEISKQKQDAETQWKPRKDGVPLADFGYVTVKGGWIKAQPIAPPGKKKRSFRIGSFACFRGSFSLFRSSRRQDKQ
ncbi:hypothetical protein NEDG_01744 [Nematocida displodere]|uniref:Uncharacterized protein n=1 Tax=Nematocida displodere TaxID=1805483 RepID=A0A177EF95_9MICR|nr:hypothetical protein NEDG_01744 [Nematocida displodere]